MTRRIRCSAGLVTLVGLAACGGQASTVSADMQRDLDLAGTSAIELAPRAAQTQVVSAIELGKSVDGPKAETPKAAPARQTPRAPKAQVASTTPAAPAETRQVASAPEPRGEPEPAAQAPSPVADVPVSAPAPPVERAPVLTTPVPSTSRAPSRGRGRNGGWWSTGDVIRNAPFPINP